MRSTGEEVDVEKLRKFFKAHVSKLKMIKGLKEPSPGELALSYLEEEFED